MRPRWKFFSGLVIVGLMTGAAGCGSSHAGPDDESLSFIVTADMRNFAGGDYHSPQYFLGACRAIRKVGAGAFMISPGDLDPPEPIRGTIDKALGEDYLWYPVVGNHDTESDANMEWLRDWARQGIPHLVRQGPPNGEETIYSFDFGEAHCIVLNLYYTGETDANPDGDVCDLLYDWLVNDLEQTSKPFVFVFGHEPIAPIADADNGRSRHVGESLDEHPENAHRLRALLTDHGVAAYICGHTHNFSFAKLNGLWQIDAGHARGLGDPGAPSTFLKVTLRDGACSIEVFRDDGQGGPYTLSRTITLD
ncbi:MAG: metallophosphoesterase [Planctomycetota bacterium]